MKRYMWIIGILAIGYIIASNFFINFFPPTEKELAGNYESHYENKVYRLMISSDKTVSLEVTKNNTILYQDTCRDYSLEMEDYGVFPIATLSFNKCKNMDSNTILKRDLWFNVLIGNNGSELRRIDPDENIYFKKID